MFSGSLVFITSSENTFIPKSWRTGIAGRGARRPLAGHEVIAFKAESRARDGRMACLQELVDEQAQSGSRPAGESIVWSVGETPIQDLPSEGVREGPSVTNDPSRVGNEV
jgi:hypothetical protein